MPDWPRRLQWGVSEDELVAALAQIFGAPSAERRSDSAVALGIGDDAAILKPHPSSTVVSVDAAVEGVHFRFEYGSAEALGARAFLAAASDLAAMGATPSAALISIALPPSRRELALSIAEGIASAARSVACPVIGGNVSRASEVSIHTTVMGTLPADATPLTRAGARVGDALFVTGTLGAAALGLAAIQRGYASEELLAPFVGRWREARAQVALGMQLRGVASACLDVSDGLLRDARRLAEASEVTLTIDADALPLDPEHARAAQLLGLDPLALALSGGEDYELLFTADPSFAAPWASRIGAVTDRREAPLEVRLAGAAIRLERLGHDHFE
jgi:thiamine-monophosphate kinase